jgi:hypothetical protein
MSLNRFSLGCVAVAVLAASSSICATASAQYDYALLLTGNISSAGNGASIVIETAQISTETCSNHVNHEMWYGTYGDAFQYWIEVGFKAGDPGSAGQSCITDPTSSEFWCDKRNVSNGSYNCHFYNYGWTLGDEYIAQIDNIASCTWAVWLGGVQLGTSTSNCAGSTRAIEAGFEHYFPNNETDYAYGFLTNWREEESPIGGPWINTWDGFYTGVAYGNSGEQQPYIYLIENNTWTEEGLLQ